jgi:hypothetical protein
MFGLNLLESKIMEWVEIKVKLTNAIDEVSIAQKLPTS